MQYLVAFGYEKIWLLKHESAKIIVYDKINLIMPDKYAERIGISDNDD
jgi:hypothetical protein